MRCYTVFGASVFMGLPVTTQARDRYNGVGLGSAGILFESNQFCPQPEIRAGYSDSYRPNLPGVTYIGSVSRADIWQFEHQKYRYDPIVVAEQNSGSKNALILWVVDELSVLNPDSVKKAGDVVIPPASSSRYPGYWQLLATMVPGSSLIGTGKYYQTTVSWDGSDLHVVSGQKGK